MGLFDFLGYLGQGAGAIATGQMRGEQNALDILARRRAAKELADLKRQQLQAEADAAQQRAAFQQQQQALSRAQLLAPTFFGDKSADILADLERNQGLGAAVQAAAPVFQQAGLPFDPEAIMRGTYQGGIPEGAASTLDPQAPGGGVPWQPQYRYQPSTKTQQAGAKVDIAGRAEDRKGREGESLIRYRDAKTGQIVELTPYQVEDLKARTEGTQAKTLLTQAQTVFETLRPGIEGEKLDIQAKLLAVRQFAANDTAKRWRAQLGETARHNRSTEAIAQQRAKTAQQVADLRGVLAKLAVAKSPYEIAYLKNKAAVLGSLLDPTKKMALAAKLKVATQLMNVGGVQVPMDPSDTERMFGEIDAILGGIEEGAQTPAAEPPLPAGPAGAGPVAPVAAPASARAVVPPPDRVNRMSSWINQGVADQMIRNAPPEIRAQLKADAVYVKKLRASKGRR